MSESKAIRVLVAEDDYLVGEEIARTLKQVDCEVAGEAADGAEAVEKVLELRPDVVLMDIKMPRESGLKATRRIQETCPTPIVVLSAYESNDLVEEATEAGVSAYLTKPPAPGELSRAIRLAKARHEELIEYRRRLNESESRVEELEMQAADAKGLDGFITICAQCLKVRVEEGVWQRLDWYVREHTNAEISHGLCPPCAAEAGIYLQRPKDPLP